jgi:hypothetical protein
MTTNVTLPLLGSLLAVGNFADRYPLSSIFYPRLRTGGRQLALLDWREVHKEELVERDRAIQPLLALPDRVPRHGLGADKHTRRAGRGDLDAAEAQRKAGRRNHAVLDGDHAHRARGHQQDQRQAQGGDQHAEAAATLIWQAVVWLRHRTYPGFSYPSALKRRTLTRDGDRTHHVSRITIGRI